ncbi:MAG: DUF488 domain-containing protein [Burkholderiales bacterium]
MLLQAKVSRLVDVRAYPRSRRYPQFGYGPLGARLAAAGIAYEWRGDSLGGMRRGSDESSHPGLREPSFRAYAEHMQSEIFRTASARLLADGRQGRLCIMCAERDPARCHRSLIADWLVVQGAEVIHLLDREEAPRAHTLHPALRVEQGILRYAGGVAQGELF